MTPREPDRFEARARDLCLTEWRRIAAALRAAESEALERAAQWCESLHASYGWMPDRIRALKEPAAAPAAETGTCANFWHPGHGHEPHARRAAVGDLSAPHADHVNDSGCLNWKPAVETGKAEEDGISLPLSLAQRILAALESDPMLRALAAELREGMPK